MSEQIDTDSPVLGEKILALRIKQAPNEARAAWAIRNKVSESVLIRAERSDPTVSYRSLMKIAIGLNVPISEIYTDAPEDVPVLAEREQMEAFMRDIKQQNAEILRTLQRIERRTV